MTTQLFTRAGQAFTGHVIQNERGRPCRSVTIPCGRCGGAGGSERWAHTGWTCYECGGRGDRGTRPDPLYTAERLAKLDATRAKRLAVKRAEIEARESAARASAESKRTAFQEQFADILPWLEGAGLARDESEADRRIYAKGFLGDMLARADARADFTEAQAAAIRASMARAIETERQRSRSAYVGEIGKRQGFRAVVERVSSYDRPCFGRFGNELVYIVTMRDNAGNALISKSPSFYAERGEVLHFKATPKEHSEFRGEQQTVLQRIAIIEKESAQPA